MVVPQKVISGWPAQSSVNFLKLILVPRRSTKGAGLWTFLELSLKTSFMLPWILRAKTWVLFSEKQAIVLIR